MCQNSLVQPAPVRRSPQGCQPDWSSLLPADMKMVSQNCKSRDSQHYAGKADWQSFMSKDPYFLTRTQSGCSIFLTLRPLEGVGFDHRSCQLGEPDHAFVQRFRLNLKGTFTEELSDARPQQSATWLLFCLSKHTEFSEKENWQRSSSSRKDGHLVVHVPHRQSDSFRDLARERKKKKKGKNPAKLGDCGALTSLLCSGSCLLNIKPVFN